MNGSSAFGFGKNIQPPAATETANSKGDLRTKLQRANNDSTQIGIVILVDGNANADYDFGGEVLPITGKRIVIRGKTASKAVLKNVVFAINLDTADQLILEDLTFRSDSGGNPEDAIRIEATAPAAGATRSTLISSVRISYCTFDGYSDIAIDTKTAVGRPRLFATIDHCLFYESNPGVNGPNQKKFFNRGAINIASLQPGSHGDSFVTIANNVYIDVWRRLPRVAGGNFVHVFNNLLYRWGFTPSSKSNQTYRGIEIGGGEVFTTDNGKALIEANRFIPASDKNDIGREIAFNQGTQVTLGTGTNVNEFDGPNGTILGDGQPIPAVAGSTSTEGTFVAATVYRSQGANFTAPDVALASTFAWRTLVAQAGSRVLAPPATVKSDVTALLATADANRP